MIKILLHQSKQDTKDPTKFTLVQPWVILDNKGTVEGEEFLLAGFVKNVPFKHIDVDFQTFYDNPYMAVGKYVVFIDDNGELLGDKIPVTRIEIKEY